MANTDKAFLIYRNARCSKSRQTPTPLRAKGMQRKANEYLQTPPGPAGLRFILALLDLEPCGLSRSEAPAYRERPLDLPGLTREAPNRAMVQPHEPIERPMVLANQRALLGRRPEAVLELL